MAKVNTAVIGLGMFGALQAQVYAESPLAELKAVVSRTPERAREIGERFGAHWYTDFDEMLDKEKEVNAVSIANRTQSTRRRPSPAPRRGRTSFWKSPWRPRCKRWTRSLRRWKRPECG